MNAVTGAAAFEDLNAVDVAAENALGAQYTEADVRARRTGGAEDIAHAEILLRRWQLARLRTERSAAALKRARGEGFT